MKTTLKLQNLVGAALAVSLSLFGGIAYADFTPVTILNSPDTAPTGVGSPANMNLSTLLTGAGIGSNLVTDQIGERAFGTIAGYSPQIDVLFGNNVRSAAAGYKPYHRIGWYQRPDGGTVPPESNIKDVVWESGAYANNAYVSSQKLTTSLSDFSGIDNANPFELRLSNATPGNDRGGSIYGNDDFNVSGFRNIAYFKERDLQGNLIPNSYIVAWEDLRGGGDKDYQDMVIRVKYVTAVAAPTRAVPEAGTLAMAMLGGVALLGGVTVRRRK